MVEKPNIGPSMHNWKGIVIPIMYCGVEVTQCYCIRVYGEIALCRKVLLLGVNSASDDPDSMCEELLQFEREEGM